MSDPTTLDQAEVQILKLQVEIARLRRVAIRLDEARKLPGAAARKWLIRNGANEEQATAEIVGALNERRAAAGHPPVGQCSRRPWNWPENPANAPSAWTANPTSAVPTCRDR